MADSSGFVLPPSAARVLFALVTHLVLRCVDLLDQVIRARRWAPWVRFAGTVVLVVLVVVVLRAAPVYGAGGQLLR